jgi:D-alanyl-D-alanine carboxypeptidase
MTAYLVLRDGQLGRTETVPPLALAEDESAVGLAPGQRLRRARLLAALVVASAGDAARTLAAAVGGSPQAFVRRMNAAARRLGLRGTRYANPSGLDAPGAHSTVRDSLRLAWLLMQDPRFRALADRQMVTINGRTYRATNHLLGAGLDVDGVKTGHTGAAGWSIVASAWRDGRRMYVCVLGAPTRDARDSEAAALLDRAFAAAE